MIQVLVCDFDISIYFLKHIIKFSQSIGMHRSRHLQYHFLQSLSLFLQCVNVLDEVDNCLLVSSYKFSLSVFDFFKPIFFFTTFLWQYFCVLDLQLILIAMTGYNVVFTVVNFEFI